MSEFLKGIQSSFDASTKQIAELSEDLNRLADLDEELSALSDSLKLATNNLRKLSGDHSKFISKADDTNNNLQAIASKLKEFDPQRIETKLSKLSNMLDNIQERLEADLPSTLVRTKWIIRLLIFMLVCQAAGFILLVNRLY